MRPAVRSSPARDAAARRDAIARAATEAIALYGLEIMPLGLLARGIDTPSRTIGALFGTRQALFVELCDRQMDALIAAAETADLPRVRHRRRLDALARALVESGAVRPAGHRVLAMGLASLPAPALRDILHKRRWLVTLLTEALRAGLPRASGRKRLVTAGASVLLTLLLAERPDGERSAPMGRQAYAQFATDCVLRGLRATLSHPTRRTQAGRVRSGSR